MNGRVFDITTRRFLTRDVVPDQPFTTFGTHPYAYVGNNPTTSSIPPASRPTPTREETGKSCATRRRIGSWRRLRRPR